MVSFVTLVSTRPLWTVIQRSMLVWHLSEPNSGMKSPERTNVFPSKMGFEVLADLAGFLVFTGFASFAVLAALVAFTDFAGFAASSDLADARDFAIFPGLTGLSSFEGFSSLITSLRAAMIMIMSQSRWKREQIAFESVIPERYGWSRNEEVLAVCWCI